MTTLHARPSRSTDELKTKLSQRQDVSVTSGPSQKRQIDRPTAKKCKRRCQSLRAVIKEKPITSPKAKLNIECCNEPEAGQDVEPTSITKAVFQSPTPPIVSDLTSNASFTTNKTKESTNPHNVALQKQSHQGLITTDLEIDLKRKLRSQKSSKYKSELSVYFPEYDEVIGNKRQDDHFLNPDTSIFIFDSADRSNLPISTEQSNSYPVADYPDFVFTDLNYAEKVDFSHLLGPGSEDPSEDLFCDERFRLMHKKPQRAEKNIRNTDKERALHDKDQVIRLLEGLQGSEWLKLMGINGIPESKKRHYETARQYFVVGCKSIVAKFRAWRDEEKRQKNKKEASLALSLKEHQTIVTEDYDSNYSESEDFVTKQPLHKVTTLPITAQSNPKNRLESETFATVPLKSKEISLRLQPSSYKSHLHNSLFGRQKYTGKTEVAWGYPIPEIPAHDFELPMELREDKKLLKPHAKVKRQGIRTKTEQKEF